MNINYSINDVYAAIMEYDDEDSVLLTKDNFDGDLEELRAFVVACTDGVFDDGKHHFTIKILGVVDECNEQGY